MRNAEMNYQNCLSANIGPAQEFCDSTVLAFWGIKWENILVVFEGRKSNCHYLFKLTFQELMRKFHQMHMNIKLGGEGLQIMNSHTI